VREYVKLKKRTKGAGAQQQREEKIMNTKISYSQVGEVKAKPRVKREKKKQPARSPRETNMRDLAVEDFDHRRGDAGEPEDVGYGVKPGKTPFDENNQTRNFGREGKKFRANLIQN